MYLQTILRFLRYTFSVFYGVFFPRFDDTAHEKQFYSQEWYLGKVATSVTEFSVCMLTEPLSDARSHSFRLLGTKLGASMYCECIIRPDS